MPREFAVAVTISAAGAIAGARTFKRGADSVARSSERMTIGINRTRNSALSLVTTLGRLRGVATLAFAGFLGVGGLASIVRTISQFDTAMSAVNAIMGPRGTQGIMNALSTKARELGATTLFTATQAAEGMRFLTLAGFDALEVYQAIEPSLNLAAAGMLGLGEAADIVSNIMSAFNIDASETESVTDALAFTASRTNTDIRQLGQAMKFVGPVAGTLGVNVQETSIALGILGNSGLQASLAGTSLRRVMSGLLNPSKKATKALGEMGLTAEELTSELDKPGGLLKVIESLSAHGLDAANAFLLFGQRGAPGILSLITQLPELRKLNAELGSIAGTAERMARVMADNLGGDARIAISSLQEAVLRLGDAGLREWLRETVQGFTGFIRGASGMETATKDLTEAMTKGIKIGKLFRAQWDTIQKILVILTAVVLRNMIWSLGALAVRVIAVSWNVGALILSLRSLVQAFVVVGVASRGLTAALLPFAPILLAVGLAAAYLFTKSFSDAQTNTQGLIVDLEELATTAEELIFVFDLVGQKQRELALIRLGDSIKADRAEVLALEQELRSLSTVQDALAAATLGAAAAAKEADETHSHSSLVAAEKRARAFTDEMSRLQSILDTTNVAVVEAEIERLTERFTENEITVQAAQLVMAGLAGTLAEARAQIAGVSDAMAGWIDKFKELTGLSHQEALAFSQLVEDAEPAAKAIEEVEDKLATYTIVAGLSDAQLAKLGLTQESLIKVQKLLAYEMKEATAELNDQEKHVKKVTEAYEKQAGAINPAVKIMQEYAASVLVARSALEVGFISIDEFKNRVIELQAVMDAANLKLLESGDEYKALTKTMADEARQMEQLWDQAMRNIQDAFADAFLGAFDSFSSFADRLIEAFKELLANLAAQWAVSKIFKFFTGDISVSGNNSGGSGVSGAVASGATSTATNAILSGGSGTSGMGGAAFAAFATAATDFAVGASAFFQGIGTANIASVGSGAATAGGVVAGAGVGFASGTLVDQIVGSRGDPGTTAGLSALGGAIGSIWGPVGSLVGGAIGGFVSNLLGGAKKLEGATLQWSATADGMSGAVESIVSTQKALFGGKSLTTTNSRLNLSVLDAAFAEITGKLIMLGEGLGVDVADAISGFGIDRSINIAGQTNSQIESLIAQLFQDAVIGVISEFLSEAEGLSDRLSKSVQVFSNNSENFIRAFEAAAAIELSFLIDPLTAVMDAVAASSVTMVDAYDALLISYRELVSEYDGSLVSLESLATATLIVTQAQIDLIAALMVSGETVSALFADSAETIRQSLMDEETLYNYRSAKIDELIAQAATETDPVVLTNLASLINEFGLANFNALDESQQGILGPEFISFFEGLDAMFADNIDNSIESILADQAALDEEVADKMLEAAQALLDAAESWNNIQNPGPSYGPGYYPPERKSELVA